MRCPSKIVTLGLVLLAGLMVVGCPTSGGKGLSVSHVSYDYGAVHTEFTFYVWNAGGDTSINFSASADSDWISLSPTSGTASGVKNSAAVTATIDRTQFEQGGYSGVITVASPGATSKTITVRARVGLSAVGVSTLAHDFGPAGTDLTVEVWNAGELGSHLDFTAAADQPWITVSPTSGSSADADDRVPVSIAIDRAIMTHLGGYEGAVTVSSADGSSQVIQLSARAPRPAISISKNFYDFGALDTDWSFQVWNSGEAGSLLSFSVTANRDWISVSPAVESSTGLTDKRSIAVIIDRDLAAKSILLEGVITVAAAGVDSRTINIRARIAEPEINLSTSILDFGGADLTRTFSVSNSGEEGSILDFRVSSNRPWIQAAPAIGTSSTVTDRKVVTVSVNRAAASKDAESAPKGITDGYRTTVGTGADRVHVVVVKGTPYEMGYDIGSLMAAESAANMVDFLAAIIGMGFTEQMLDDAWDSVSPYVDQRFKDEIKGFSDGLTARGVGLSYQDVIRVHMLPVVAPYSCSAIAVWGAATRDGHLYQIRNLDWELESGLQDNPWVVIYQPDVGAPHANVGFVGMLGSVAGMNARGIALSEVGDSPSREMPYNLNGEHFSTMCRRILYDADSLTEALGILSSTARIKRYHYVFGDGKAERKAVKIKAHAPETPPNDLIVWGDNDPADPVLDRGLGTFTNVVYHAEGRDPIAYNHIAANYGAYDADLMVDLSRAVATRGSNLMNVVYDATSLEIWVAFAEGASSEAYLREYVHINLYDFIEPAPGEYSGTITVSSDKAPTKTVAVKARQPKPGIGLSAAFHDFGLANVQWQFDIWNSGDAGTALQFEATADEPWIGLALAPGSDATSTDPSDISRVVVTIDRDALAKALLYTGTITVSAGGESQQIQIMATN